MDSIIKFSKVIIFISFIIFYFAVQREYKIFLKEKDYTTNSVISNYEIRENVVKELNGTSEKLEKEKNEKLENEKQEEEEQKKVENVEKLKEEKEIKEKNIKEVKKVFKKRYIQAATFKTENSAQIEANRLGKGFKVKKVDVKGKSFYQVVTDDIDNQEVFNQLEARAKKLGMNYIVRTVE